MTEFRSYQRSGALLQNNEATGFSVCCKSYRSEEFPLENRVPVIAKDKVVCWQKAPGSLLIKLQQSRQRDLPTAHLGSLPIFNVSQQYQF